jgi:hypothetical protein
VSADGRGLVSEAGSVLMRVTGLGQGLSAGLAWWRAPRAVHDPGKIIADSGNQGSAVPHGCMRGLDSGGPCGDR